MGTVRSPTQPHRPVQGDIHGPRVGLTQPAHRQRMPEEAAASVALRVTDAHTSTASEGHGHVFPDPRRTVRTAGGTAFVCPMIECMRPMVARWHYQTVTSSEQATAQPTTEEASHLEPDRVRLRGRSRRVKFVARTVFVAALITIAMELALLGSALTDRSNGAAGTESISAPEVQCPEGRTELTILGPERIAPALLEAGLDACVEILLEDPGPVGLISERLHRGDADVWIAGSSEQVKSVGVPNDSWRSLFQSPIVIATSDDVGPVLGGSDWRDSFSTLPSGVGLQIADASSQGDVQSAILTTVAEHALESNGASLAVVGDTIESLSAAAQVEGAATVIVADEIAALPDEVSPMAIGPLATLDYPLVLSENASPASRAAADSIFAAIDGWGGDILAKYGLEHRDATAFTIGETVLPLIPHGTEDVYSVVSSVLDPSLLTGSLTVLLDVSGSMNETEPSGVSGISAVRDSVSVLGQTVPSGLLAEWSVFGTGIGDGGGDRRIFSSGIIATTRKEVADAAAELVAEPVGTPLYQVVVDSYREIRARASTEAISVLVVVTDGRDEDADGRIGREEALTALRELSDPSDPVPILFMGFGDVDLPAMQEVVAITGGNAWDIQSPAALSAAIAEAVLAVGSAHLKTTWTSSR